MTARERWKSTHVTMTRCAPLTHTNIHIPPPADFSRRACRASERSLPCPLYTLISNAPMPSFTFSHILAMLIIVYLCLVAPSASGKLTQRTTSVSRYRVVASQTKSMAKLAHDIRHNGSSTMPVPTTRMLVPMRRTSDRNKGRSAPKNASIAMNMARARTTAAGKTLAQTKTFNKTKTIKKTRPQTPTPTKRSRQNDEPTPEPTGNPSTSTTVYIEGENTFALLLPSSSGGKYPNSSCWSLSKIPSFAEVVSDAEQDGITYCTDGTGCGNPFPDGFITGAAYWVAPDRSYVQVGTAATQVSRTEVLRLFALDDRMYGFHPVPVCGRR